MTVRPGLNAVRLAAALFAAAFGMFLSVHVLWLLLAGFVIGLALAVRDWFALRKLLPRVAVSRRVPAVVGRGDPFEVEWTIATDLSFPISGELRDECPECAFPRLVIHNFSCRPAIAAPREAPAAATGSTLSQTFTIPIRGRFEFGPLWVRLPGPAKFLDGHEQRDQFTSVRVLPETYASPDRFQKELGAEIRLLDKLVFARQHGDGTEFESLKEFRPGDDPRRIDWRATVRHQRTVIRKFQIERHRDVMIVIDCGRLMGGQVESADEFLASDDVAPASDSAPDASHPAGENAAISGRRAAAIDSTPLAPSRGAKLDCAVDSALLLARIALQGGDRCGFALFDHSVRGYLPPVSGLAAMPALVDCIYDAAVDWGESDFAPLFALLQARQAKRSLVVILSDLLDAATSEQFRGALRQLSQRHVVLFAALRTPLLNDVVRRPVTTLEAASRQAVAYRLLHDREEALQTLRHAGVHVLDVEPRQLTAPLINEFISIRRRNLL